MAKDKIIIQEVFLGHIKNGNVLITIGDKERFLNPVAGQLCIKLKPEDFIRIKLQGVELLGHRLEDYDIYIITE